MAYITIHKPTSHAFSVLGINGTTKQKSGLRAIIIKQAVEEYASLIEEVSRELTISKDCFSTIRKAMEYWDENLTTQMIFYDPKAYIFCALDNYRKEENDEMVGKAKSEIFKLESSVHAQVIISICRRAILLKDTSTDWHIFKDNN